MTLFNKNLRLQPILLIPWREDTQQTPGFIKIFIAKKIFLIVENPSMLKNEDIHCKKKTTSIFVIVKNPSMLKMVFIIMENI